MDWEAERGGIWGHLGVMCVGGRERERERRASVRTDLPILTLPAPPPPDRERWIGLMFHRYGGYAFYIGLNVIYKPIIGGVLLEYGIQHRYT